MPAGVSGSTHRVIEPLNASPPSRSPSGTRGPYPSTSWQGAVLPVHDSIVVNVSRVPRSVELE